MSTKRTNKYYRELKYTLEVHGIYDDFLNTLSTRQKEIFELKVSPNNLSNGDIGVKQSVTHQSINYQLDLIDQTSKVMLSMPARNSVPTNEEEVQSLPPAPIEPSYYEVNYTMMAAAFVANGCAFPRTKLRDDGQLSFFFEEDNLEIKEMEFYRNTLLVDAKSMAEAYKQLISKIHESKGNIQRSGF